MHNEISLNGIAWDHVRGYDPMIAATEAFRVQNPHVTIGWDKRPLQAFADRPIEIMAQEYDLIVVDHPHVGAVARNGVLAALDRKDRHAELEALAAASIGGSHESYQFEDRQWALAIDAATPVSAYREDASLTVPRTWDGVMEIARSGDACLALAPINAAMTFFGMARNLGFEIAATEEELIAASDAELTLENLRELATYVDQRCLGFDPIQIYDWMSTEEAAPPYSVFGYGYTNYSRDRFRKFSLVFADAPGFDGNGPAGTVLGGAGIAVSQQSSHLEEAIDFAYFVASEECQSTLYFDAGGQPAHAAAWDSDACNRASRNFFRNTRRTLDTAWIRPRYDGYMDLQALAGEIIHDCICGQISLSTSVERLNAAYRETRI